MVTTRKDQKAATRRAMIAAAKKVIKAKGVEETTVTDITKAAGVAHGTFYVHFESKESLVRLLIEEFNQQLLEDIQRQWNESADAPPGDLLGHIGAVYLKKMRSERGLILRMGQMYESAMPVQWLLEGVNPPLVQLIISRMTPLASELGVDGLDIEMLTHAIMGMWLRLGFRYALSSSHKQKAAVEMLVELTIGALARYFPAVGIGGA